MGHFSDLDKLAFRDAKRSVKRHEYREAWRNSPDPYKRRAVILAERGNGAWMIEDSCGIPMHQALRLVTGE